MSHVILRLRAKQDASHKTEHDVGQVTTTPTAYASYQALPKTATMANFQC